MERNILEPLEEIRTCYLDLYSNAKTPDGNPLSEFEAEISQDDDVHSHKCSFRFSSDFKPIIESKITSIKQTLVAFGSANKEFIKPDFSDQNVEILSILQHLGEDSRNEYVLKRTPSLIGKTKTKFKKAEAYIINGPPHLAEFGTITFERKNYSITVERSHDAHQKITGAPKLTSGYLLTHTLKFKVTSSKNLNPTKILNILHYFLRFLGFVRGAKTSTAAIFFLDHCDQAKCIALGCGPASPLPHPLSWHIEPQVDQLPLLYNNFIELEADEKWKRGLNEAISWYTIANKPGNELEASIVLGQAALEALTYAHFVYDQRLREKMIIDMNAADKIEMLLASFNIKNAPLEHAPELTQTCKDNKFPERDCAKLTTFRNKLVHARSINYTGLAALQAQRAYLWIIETVILSRLGYQGEYQDQRIISGYRGANLTCIPDK
jgi:hypothetical protein